MRKTLSIAIPLLLGIALKTAINNNCYYACKEEIWNEGVTFKNVFIDTNKDGIFDPTEKKETHTILKEEMAYIKYVGKRKHKGEDIQTREIYIYDINDKTPTYKIKGLTLITFEQKSILPEQRSCCYLRVQNKIDPIFTPEPNSGFIRIDKIEDHFKNEKYQLEIKTNDGKEVMTVQKDKRQTALTKIAMHGHCNCH